MSEVLVLNSAYQALNITSMRRALKMLLLCKADVVENNGRMVNTPRFSMMAPSVIRLRYYVRVPDPQVALTKKNILWRDQFTCQYCGRKQTADMTVDHVVPRSMGGRSTWENLVCACRECNNKKNNRHPQAARMTLLKSPARPRYKPWLRINRSSIPREWLPFLGG